MKNFLITTAIVVALGLPVAAGGIEIGDKTYNTNRQNQGQHQGQAQGQAQGQGQAQHAVLNNRNSNRANVRTTVSTERSAPGIGGHGIGGGGSCQNAISLGGSGLYGAGLVGARYSPRWCKHGQIAAMIHQYAGRRADQAALQHLSNNIPEVKQTLRDVGMIASKRPKARPGSTVATRSTRAVSSGGDVFAGRTQNRDR